jgi:hypothetical protein
VFNLENDISDLEMELFHSRLKDRGELNFHQRGKFPWLLSRWHDPIWVLTGRNSSKELTVNIHWAILLPNGDYLTSPKHKELLETLKRLVALQRFGRNASTSSSHTQLNTALYLTSIVRWMSLRGLGSSPFVKLSFSSLTKDDFEDFCQKLPHGFTGVEMKCDRVAEFLRVHTSEQIRPNSILSSVIDRRLIASATNISPNSMANARVEATVRKFEYGHTYPIFQASQNYLRREFIGHKQLTFDKKSKMLASETVVNDFLNTWKLLHDHSSAIDGLLTFDPYESSCVANVIKAIPHTPKGRTPSIPMDIGLFYLDASIKWVIIYGDKLTDLWLECESKWQLIQPISSGRRDHYAPRIFESLNTSFEINGIKITRYNRNQSSFTNKEIRSNLSLEEAIDCLYAACFIIIATFSARRKEEILNLTIDCIESDYDGYVLDFLAQKISSSNKLEQLKRPVPDLVLNAVLLLKKIQSKNRDELDVSEAGRLLFARHTGERLVKPSNQHLVLRLDLFADVIQVPTFSKPTEEHLRRWYVRPHEIRRFFALTFFWSTPDSKLDSLGWFMGHVSNEQTERYITESMGGDAIPESILNLLVTALDEKIPGKKNSAFEEIILDEFNQAPIETISARNLEAFLTDLIEKKQVSVEVIDVPPGFRSISGKEICIKTTRVEP